jgi:hypothetical protein
VKVAHELKNPLSAVKALVQLGLRNSAESASHERLAVLEREVTRMQEILMSYLAPPDRSGRSRRSAFISACSSPTRCSCSRRGRTRLAFEIVVRWPARSLVTW